MERPDRQRERERAEKGERFGDVRMSAKRERERERERERDTHTRTLNKQQLVTEQSFHTTNEKS